MTNKETILNELNSLESSLANYPIQNTYSVPEGYFEGLAAEVLNRIKAMQTSDAKEELALLSPLLSSVPKINPYRVPDNYFENLSNALHYATDETVSSQTSDEEIESLSPLLSDLKNRTTYAVPAGYFDSLYAKTEKKKAKVVAFGQSKWYRLAAAAIVIGIVTIGGIFYFNPAQVDPNKNPDKWISKNVSKKVSEEKIDEFVALSEENDIKNNDESESIQVAEVKELLKDVSDKEIEDFLNDAVALESNDGTDIFLN